MLLTNSTTVGLCCCFKVDVCLQRDVIVMHLRVNLQRQTIRVLLLLQVHQVMTMHTIALQIKQ
jgi:hypothetical protein